MRRITGFLMIMLAVASTAMAQTQPAARAERVMPIPGVQLADQILAQREQLGLTEQQVTRIREVRAQLERQNRPLVEQLQSARAQPRQLQEPQRRPQAQRAQPQQQLRGRMLPQGRAAELRQRGANLSDEQRAELRARLRARQDSMWARQDTMRARLKSLTDEQRQAVRQMMRQRQLQRPAMVQPQLRANAQHAIEQIEAILTPAQRTKLRELRQGRGGR